MSEDDNLLLKMHGTAKRSGAIICDSSVRELHVDDLVLQWVLTREGANKLSPGWEGSFRVNQVYHHGCVRLATKDGEPLPNHWNIEHLCKFYP
jgi:hypothetical protein